MVKPRKKRNVLYPPKTLYFKPQGSTGKEPEVVLSIDEYEAVRLADYQNLKQEQAASMMNISRPTFTRLIDSARQKIAKAIVGGRAIRIEGGDFIFLKNRIRCDSCGNIWETEQMQNKEKNCPQCDSQQVTDVGNMLSRGPRRRRRGGW
ncbi:MAG: DUF134 domain-containing protein [Actinomycetota bacterium]|nr:DUF134 domain-containing protein [Actinomycetota bacterium]